ncbi:MAG: hypothetical protein JW750_08540 [Anaerolineaceae bacterium]|nr:hypothetical protein [Anaerolineaceae bacterium]
MINTKHLIPFALRKPSHANIATILTAIIILVLVLTTGACTAVSSQPIASDGFIQNDLTSQALIAEGSSVSLKTADWEQPIVTLPNTSIDPLQESSNDLPAELDYELETSGLPEAAADSGPVDQTFARFSEKMITGNADELVAVYVKDVLALRVVQQPVNDPGYVPGLNGLVSQFRTAKDLTGNLGLLAHNYLSGSSFFELKAGDQIQLVYGDGRVAAYQVEVVKQYQALTPSSALSDFVDLESGERLTSTQLFYQVYGKGEHLTLQTCIEQGGNWEWGRLFVIAVPLNS